MFRIIQILLIKVDLINDKNLINDVSYYRYTSVNRINLLRTFGISDTRNLVSNASQHICVLFRKIHVMNGIITWNYNLRAISETYLIYVNNEKKITMSFDFAQPYSATIFK